ncbi:MAG: META domain-containing protein [Propionibacteriaceae bacterium]|nr:META domain-containing protein [Propionibacteriaceae bacterium]
MTSKISTVRKTLVAAALAVFVALPLSACGSTSDDPIVGKWEVIEVDGKSIDMIAWSMSIDFKANGKLIAIHYGDKITGTWTTEGTKVTIKDSRETMVCDYTVATGKLMLNDCDGVVGSSLTLVPA